MYSNCIAYLSFWQPIINLIKLTKDKYVSNITETLTTKYKGKQNENYQTFFTR